MIAQDLTKFTVVLVILGIVLAIAIFRPQILLSPPVEPTPTKEPEPDGLIDVGLTPELGGGEEVTLSYAELQAWQEELERREGELDQRQADLDAREARLNRRQAELDDQQRELDQRQTELDAREAGLDGRQAELDEREAKSEEQAAFLQAWEVRLQEAEARLRAGLSALAEQEQKLQGFLRWSVVAFVVSGLLAVPSALVLVALGRQNRRASGTAKQAQTRQTHQRGQIVQYGRPPEVGSASTFSDNGRDRERVGCRVQQASRSSRPV